MALFCSVALDPKVAFVEKIGSKTDWPMRPAEPNREARVEMAGRKPSPLHPHSAASVSGDRKSFLVWAILLLIRQVDRSASDKSRSGRLPVEMRWAPDRPPGFYDRGSADRHSEIRRDHFLGFRPGDSLIFVR